MANVRKKGRGYEIRVYCGTDIYGKRLEKSKIWVPSVTMTSRQIEKELERQKILFENEVKNAYNPNENITFSNFAKLWLETYGKNNLANSTYVRYTVYLQRINEAIGNYKLKEITPLHLNMFYKSLEADGLNKRKRRDSDGRVLNNGKLSLTTIADHNKIISSILSTAVKWGYVTENAARKADPPKAPYRETACLNEEQTKHLIELLENEPMQYKTMIILLLYTGMRRGELCGLEWNDIDFENQKMRICRSSVYIGGKELQTKEPKTKAGIREITLSKTACVLLKQFKTWQLEQRMKIGDQWVDCDKLFTKRNGLPIHPDTISGWFPKFLKRTDLPHVTLHSLRHTHATLLIAEGTDICTVSKRLGHATTAITLNVYTHALQSKDKEAANAIESVLALKSQKSS